MYCKRNFHRKWTTQKFPVLRNAAQDHTHLNSTGTFVNNLSRMMQSTIGFSTLSSLPFVSLICIVVEKLSKFHGTGTTHRDRKFVVPRAFFAVLKNLSGRCVCVCEQCRNTSATAFVHAATKSMRLRGHQSMHFLGRTRPLMRYKCTIVDRTFDFYFRAVRISFES